MKILEIAKYEFLLLRRTTRFKLVTLLYIIIIGLVNFGIANINKNGESPLITSLYGFSPYVSCFLFSLISAFIIPFILGNFLIDDKKIRVNEVIYSKPISNVNYIIGKFIGSNLALITICLIILLVSSVLQITIAVRAFKIYPYITSFLLICLPMIIFLTGLVYALNFILKNRFLVFLAVVGISFLSIFIINDKAFRLFDFAAITLPVNPSDIIGYGNITREIMQRIAYVFFGLSLLFLSAVFSFRLAGIKSLRIKMLTISIVTALIPLLLFITIINENFKNEQYRINTLKTHDKYSEFPSTNVTHYYMDISLFPSRQKLKADVKMIVSYSEEKNPEKLILVLNSGLKITKVTDENSNDIPYIREYSIIALDIKNAHPKIINISYEGSINEHSFYLLGEREKNIIAEFAGVKLSQIRWNIGECSSWLGKNGIFLIPESRWYPISGTDYKNKTRISKPANFSTADISVTVPEKYKVITQGSLINTSIEDNKAIYTYKTDIPVPQFSINAGEYIVKHTRVDSIDFYVYYSPHHKRYAEFFADTSNFIDETIKELKDWIETETTLKYPYTSFSMVEVPLDFKTHSETYEDFNPMVQPGIVMITENNINLYTVQYVQWFNSEQRNAKRIGNEFNASERKKFLLLNYLAGNLAGSGKFGTMSSQNGDFPADFLNIVTQLWGFQTGNKDRLSGLMRKGINRQHAFFLGAGLGLGDIPDKALIFDTIESKPFTEFSPEEDGKIYNRLIELKIYGILRSLSQKIGEERYKETIIIFLEKYRYKNFSFEDFKNIAEEISGKDLEPFFYQWFNTPQLPGYTITKAESYPLVTKGLEPRYQMKVRVRNLEEGHGNIRVHFKTEKDDIYRDVPFESFEEKEIGIIVPDKPVNVEIDPIVAKNWTNPRFIYTLPEKPVNAVPFEGIKIVIPEKSNEIIVDDQDDDFSIVSLKKERKRIFGKEENESNIKEEFRGFTDLLISRLNNWTRVNHYQSYGKYRNTLLTKNKGEGKSYASWKTVIPEDGIYEAYIFINNYTRNLSMVGESIGSVFYITVVHGAGESNVDIKTSRDMDGWHHLGEYEYKKGETAEIRLSDRSDDGVVIADAVKWVPAD